MRPEAATQMYATYDDPSDEWPTYALREVKKAQVYELYDDEARYTIKGTKVEILEHTAGETPVVKVQNQLDLLGTPMGEIEPVIPIQDRIVDATFTLQMVA